MEGIDILLWDQLKVQLYAKCYNYLSVINPLPIMACIIILSVMLKSNFKWKKRAIIWSILCSIWLTIIFEITLLGRQNNVVNTWESIFSSFSELLSGNYTIIYDMLFNGILFVPLGFFMKIKYSVKCSAAITGGVSLFVEVMQLITHRGLFEISDLIFNTIGGMVGIVCMFFIQKFLKKYFKNVRFEKT